jgi:hypothetical protein
MWGVSVCNTHNYGEPPLNGYKTGNRRELRSEEELVKCLLCGTTNPARWTICSSCGKPPGDAKSEFILQAD